MCGSAWPISIYDAHERMFTQFAELTDVLPTFTEMGSVTSPPTYMMPEHHNPAHEAAESDAKPILDVVGLTRLTMITLIGVFSMLRHKLHRLAIFATDRPVRPSSWARLLDAT